MTRDFVERNKLAERYLAGKLPARAAADFERFCKDNPDLLDAIGLADRVNMGLRLLEAGGKPEPWAEKSRAKWDQPHVTIAAGIAAVVLLITAIVLGTRVSERGKRIAALETAVAEQPLQPATSTRSILLIPARGGPTKRPAVTVGAGYAQFADIKIDLTWSKFTTYRVTIDREDQGRVAVIYNALKDSNGHVRLAFNTSALGPGNYNFTIQGLTWRGEPIPQAWATVAVTR